MNKGKGAGLSLSNIFSGIAIAGALVVTPHMAAAAESKASIELYSASYCSECARAKTYLKKNGIPYVDYDIENDIEKRREFYARGGRVIPLFFFGGRKMEGFDPQRLEALRRQE